MQLINKSKTSHKALKIIEDTIKKYNTHPLQYIKLSESKNKDLDFYGILKCPKNKLWKMVCAVPKDWKYPAAHYMVIGFNKNRTKKYKIVTFLTYDHAMLYIFFHEWFHYSRRTNQISISTYGINIEPNANKYALDKLKQIKVN